MNDIPRYPQVIIDVAPDESDEVAAHLFELGAEGVEQRDESTLAAGSTRGKTTLVASFASRARAEEAAKDLDPAWSPRVSELVGDEWRDEWKKYFVPFRLTERITIRPPWQTYTPSRPGELVLELEPGRAFGTGLHPTTALVARAIEELSGELLHEGNASMLDVGTGSGILALVALALGAAKARAIDVDPDAVSLAAENALRNRMSDRLVVDASPLEAVTGTYDLVAANIEASVLVTMRDSLLRRVRPGGALVLSGILAERAPEVKEAFARLPLLSSPAEGEWTALVLTGA